MSPRLLSFILCLLSGSLCAQLSSCGDPNALNYNRLSPGEGHDCQYPETFILPQTVVEIEDVPETSGLIFIEGRPYTHDDSGGEPQLYRVSLEDGGTEQILRLKDLTRDSIGDWEALCQNEQYIFIGDFGNNNGTRKDLRIYMVDKAQLNDVDDTIMLDYDIINFYYPEQQDFSSRQDHNFDCEGYIAYEDSLYMFMKHRGDLNSSLYRLPINTQDTIAAEKVLTFNTGGQVTGASYNPEKNVVALIGYINLAKPFVYLLWDFNGRNFYEGYVRRFNLPEGITGQAEAIAYLSDGQVYISNENLGVPARISVFEDSYTQASTTDILEFEKLGYSWIQESLQFTEFTPERVRAFSANGQLLREDIPQNASVDYSDLDCEVLFLQWELRGQAYYVKVRK